MTSVYQERVMTMYEEACKESDPFIRKLRIAFCIVLLEDRKLLEELGKQ